MILKLIDWFIPPEIKTNRSDAELARTFVFTHIFGPLIAQPMWIFLWMNSPEISAPLVTVSISICAFWLLPFLLKSTGNMRLSSLVSFEGLAVTSLFGSYFYGGFSSPFLPWLIVSLLLGLFYLSKDARLVLALFTTNLVFFFVLSAVHPPKDRIPIEDLAILGWLSIGSATLYMTWMALYYAVVVNLRSELEREAERSRATAAELERTRALAEETNHARSRFFSKMSHELRTPLNAIIGYSEILLEDLTDSPEPQETRARDVTRINSAGKHLLSLVSSVLDSDNIENEALKIQTSSFKLGSFLDDVVASALPMVEKNQNKLSVVCHQTERVLHTDEKKLRQIMINLLSNAGKFTNKGIVKLEAVVEEGMHEASLRLTVSDSGIGISKEALSRLFTEYEQADATVGAKFGGTGIGLALSRKFCILLGGEISVRSRPGSGSVFSVAMPAHLHEDAEPEAGKNNSYADAGPALAVG